MANLINADPTAGLKLVSSSSSDIQIQSNGVTVCTINADGLSMNTGTLAGNGPAFSAYLSASQAISAGTYVKIPFNTEEFDTNSNYDNATNYRFTPTIAGYYQISATANPSNGSTRSVIAMYKNGSEFKRGIDSSTALNIIIVNSLVYANGSTDYFEIYLYTTATGTNLGGGANNTYFSGFLARAA